MSSADGRRRAASRDPVQASRPTLMDLAREAEVSKSTASRVISGSGYAAPHVRHRVMEAAKRLGYVPDVNARSLRSKSSNTLGIIVSDLTNPFYAQLAAGAANAARGRGYNLTLVDDAGSDAGELDAARALVGMRATGVLLTPLSAATGQYLLSNGARVVEVDRRFQAGRCDAVLIDNVSASAQAADHLLALGHRRIALLIDEAEWTTGAGRLEGYQVALRRAGVEFDGALVARCGFTADDAAAGLAELLDSAGTPSAIMAANNLLAEGAWRELRRRGLSVPQEISLVAFDDTPWMTMVEPEITTVAQPAFDMGVVAAELVLSESGPSNSPKTIQLDATLLQRGSTAPPRRREPSRSRARATGTQGARKSVQKRK